MEDLLLLGAIIVALLIFIIWLLPRIESYNCWKSPKVYLYEDTGFIGQSQELKRGNKVLLGIVNPNAHYIMFWNSLHLAHKNAATLIFYINDVEGFRIRTNDNLNDLYGVIQKHTTLNVGDKVSIYYG